MARKETEDAMRQMKNNKALDSSGITIEILKLLDDSDIE